MSEIWSMVFVFDFQRRNKSYPQTEFMAENDNDAKLKVLNICKENVQRIRQFKWKYFVIQVFPCPKSDDDFSYINRTIRVKIRYANRRILRIKNPEKILVQGYGSWNF